MEPFGLTIDSLLSSHSFSIQLMYLLLSALLLLVSLCNNICSFVTFQQSTPRQILSGLIFLLSALDMGCYKFTTININSIQVTGNLPKPTSPAEANQNSDLLMNEQVLEHESVV
ncbi:unnamed protein product [Rotaria sordida]|uniref:Uncharacterized protein n=1 Tax=Rotaria sordida TaxID=392033 RepID=A0A815U7L1_9BILA|nr:unnamed protein product [Rotaria sordida]CAF1518594.1 unnamed protein product [Rotaria sordida]CAF4110078.1 unnamed protein product [Rotaria sordida]